jgi:hypothetical protein
VVDCCLCRWRCTPGSCKIYPINTRNTYLTRCCRLVHVTTSIAGQDRCVTAAWCLQPHPVDERAMRFPSARQLYLLSPYLHTLQVEGKNNKTYNTRDSPVVTHPSTNLAITGLSMGERTGSRVFLCLWSYVTDSPSDQVISPRHTIFLSQSEDGTRGFWRWLLSRAGGLCGERQKELVKKRSRGERAKRIETGPSERTGNSDTGSRTPG